MRTLNFTPFEAVLNTLDIARIQALGNKLRSATILDLQIMMAAGELSAEELTLYYLQRIQRYDGAFNSIMELNPDALQIATQLDAERATGKTRGPLHGIPIMLKDNIATGDQMHNTAGAIALMNYRAPRDAFLAKQLRKAGAILLAKTNLTEWANFMSSDAPAGHSTLGGQTVNPYGAALNVSGSSTGSAVAVAAHFTAATVGTETTGSIIGPAAANGVAGMRPTLGLISRDLIIPVTAQVDSAGPMARTVTDLAVLLTTLSAQDVNDPFAQMAAEIHGVDFVAALGSASLDGLTVACPFVEGMDNPNVEVMAKTLDVAISILAQAGATIVPVGIGWDKVQALIEADAPILPGSMAADVAHYLATAQSSMHSVEEIVAFNNADLETRAPFGQDKLEQTLSSSMDPAEHKALCTHVREQARANIHQIAHRSDADVILSLDNALSLLYPHAGVPAVTVPIGLDDAGQPHGATFVGIDPGMDARVLAIAYAFEQASKLRIEPTF